MGAPRDEEPRATPGARGHDGKDDAAVLADAAARAANAPANQPPPDVTSSTQDAEPPLHTTTGHGSTDAKSDRDSALLPPHTVVGRYIVLDHLGSGGMGVVYKAYDPDLNRQIALKLVRVAASHRTDPTVLRGRLLREAQGLAQLSHPNVVAIYDVGLFEDGVFLAMELVSGPTLREWLKTRPSYREKLRVFLAAGEGLSAAHRAGLVHRDFKPANVILGDDGRPRVLDFGLVRAVETGTWTLDDSRSSEFALGDDTGSHSAPSAKSGVFATSRPVLPSQAARRAESEDESDEPVSPQSGDPGEPLTRAGAVLGTPRYMSPEQLKGHSVDALSDQFSYCVALFEALYGSPPLRPTTPTTLREDIRARPLPRGSRVPAPVRRAVIRGLSPDEDDRFPSMEELLVELGRDRARVWRQRLALTAVVLSLGLAAWSILAGRDESGGGLCRGAGDELAAVWNPARSEGVKNAFLDSGVSYAGDTAKRVSAVLDDYGERWVAMRTESCRATHVQGVQSDKLLDLRMRCLDRKLQSLQSLVGVLEAAPDRQVVTNAVQASHGLGGLELCADARALEQEVPVPERPEDRRTLARLRGRVEKVNQLDTLGKYREAAALADELAPAVEALGFAPLQAELAYQRASCLEHVGNYAEAEAQLKKAIRLALQWGMNELVARAGASAIYLVGYRLERHDEAQVYSLMTEGVTRDRGDELEATYLDRLANVYLIQGKYAEAEALHQRTLAIRDALSADHPDLANSLNNLAIVYRKQGKYAEAEKLNQRSLAIRERVLGPVHPDVASSLNNLAIVYRKQGKNAEAEALYERAIKIKESALGPLHVSVGKSLNNLALVYREQGKFAEAEKLLLRATTIFEATLGPDHRLVAAPLVELAVTWEQQRRYVEALPILERAREIREKVAASALERAEAAFALARVLWESGKDRPRARSLSREALSLCRAANGGCESAHLDVEEWIAAHR